MKTNSEIVDLIKSLYIEKDMSMSELARQVDMAKSALSRYFSKERQFPLNRIPAFAKALNVEPEFLLGIDNTTTASTLTSIYEQLEPTRQVKVVDYAKEQLKEQEEYCFVNAAHERTDIVGTKEMKDHDNDIMDDENF
jgi:phage transcriptional repressor